MPDLHSGGFVRPTQWWLCLTYTVVAGEWWLFCVLLQLQTALMSLWLLLWTLKKLGIDTCKNQGNITGSSSGTLTLSKQLVFFFFLQSGLGRVFIITAIIWYHMIVCASCTVSFSNTHLQSVTVINLSSCVHNMIKYLAPSAVKKYLKSLMRVLE